MTFVFGGIVVGIFFGELLIKNRVEKNMAEKECRPLKCGLFSLQKYHNTGAFLNFGKNKRLLITAVSCFFSFCIFILFLFTLGTKGNSLLKTGLSILLGGAFSNTYDRLKRKYVVDYLSFRVKWKPLRRIVFNLSDFCILVGTMITVLML